MAQVVATRSIHASLLANPTQSCVDKLKPGCGFKAKVLAQTERRNRRRAVHASSPVVARRSATEVIPMSPEDLTKILGY
ncbi:plastidial pyruvate kinase 2-like isoform X2 [Salvia splendens]|uniref:plastidial pyruvate kinase 2-like isoform X2 n=1 Tax=Salvia splendens TaxID=180675 RepID=UPI001C268039|nr:plastidial pyruvate kinase 2-like isoform X2 [Salvia splendens]